MAASHSSDYNCSKMDTHSVCVKSTCERLQNKAILNVCEDRRTEKKQVDVDTDRIIRNIKHKDNENIFGLRVNKVPLTSMPKKAYRVLITPIADGFATNNAFWY